MRIFCDMDGVLVRQTGREDFDKMPWMPDGRELWKFLAPYKPTLLSQLPDENWARCLPQKVEWAARELGHDVQVIVVMRSHGKDQYAAEDAILIDDAAHTHGSAWQKAGGIFVHHINARRTISEVARFLQ